MPRQIGVVQGVGVEKEEERPGRRPEGGIIRGPARKLRALLVAQSYPTALVKIVNSGTVLKERHPDSLSTVLRPKAIRDAA